MHPVRTLVSALAVTAVGLTVSSSASATAAAGRIELVRASPSVTLDRYPGSPVYLDVGVYVGSSGGSFQIDATRAGYRSPIQLRQVGRAHAPALGRRRLERPAPLHPLHRP